MGISSLFYGLFKLESGTIVVVSLYTNEEILCTGSREEERVYVGEFPVAAINSLRRRIA